MDEVSSSVKAGDHDSTQATMFYFPCLYWISKWYPGNLITTNYIVLGLVTERLYVLQDLLISLHEEGQVSKVMVPFFYHHHDRHQLPLVHWLHLSPEEQRLAEIYH